MCRLKGNPHTRRQSGMWSIYMTAQWSSERPLGIGVRSRSERQSQLNNITVSGYSPTHQMVVFPWSYDPMVVNPASSSLMQVLRLWLYALLMVGSHPRAERIATVSSSRNVNSVSVGQPSRKSNTHIQQAHEHTAVSSVLRLVTCRCFERLVDTMMLLGVRVKVKGRKTAGKMIFNYDEGHHQN